MASIQIRHNQNGDTANYIIAVPRKSTAPLTPVVCTIDGVAAQTQKVYSAPYSETSMLVEGLDNAWYVTRFYRSSDGVALDEEINSIAQNAATGTTGTITPKYYTVGGGGAHDPVDSDTELRDPSLLGETYWIEERGTGPLKPSEYTDRSDAGGGFDLNGGKTFNDEAEYTVFVIGTATAPPSAVGGTDFNDVVVITADTDYDHATMGGKTIIADFAGTIGRLIIGSLELEPDSKFRVSTHNGNQRNSIIQLDTGDNIKYLREDENRVIMGAGEVLEFCIKNNAIYITSPLSPDAGRVCERVLSDRPATAYLNRLNLDGTLYNQVDVPRVMWAIDKYNIATVAEANWADTATVDGKTVYPNKSKFGRDDIAGTIRVPDDRDFHYRALKNIDGSSDSELYSQNGGGRQLNGVGPFTLTVPPSKLSTNDSGGVDNKFATGSTTSPGAGIDIVHTPATGSTKNKVDAVNLYPLLII